MAKQASQQSTSEETLERTVSENGIKVTIKSNHLSPGKTNSFFNPKMRQNRELVLCSLATFAGESDGPLECLDAFGATGIMGLQWAKHCNVRVVISDINEESTNLIKHNCRENKMNVKGDDDVSENPCIEVVTCDVNVLMHQRAFDF
ncbi:tRNA (guanine(27)-N(2))-dimethyltransferase-like, partial [Saccoglossus kowalevskii]